jgi:hypothetical protein
MANANNKAAMCVTSHEVNGKPDNNYIKFEVFTVAMKNTVL